ncbi:metallophosphoesterase [Thermococcus sp. Bubb.Bath]|uniref:metallophosphoesterase family protein n=1 Tax=Thermococcus sp. Bubb.Bath TaxID=1638242 RepID=UPI001439695C|nr:metallophosphoesterase [Thermococcus sp. Bubb.Bath]NJF24132.1 YfcE family phosphodiesterase [Thermococcus sp. Bubb.Bath]
MRIIGVTDIHGNIKMSHKLSEALPALSPDLLLVAGDITNFGGARTAERVLEPLLNVGTSLIAVFGNCDGKDVPSLLEELGASAHDKRVEVSGLGIVGLGGSNTTPFNTIWELSEEDIGSILERNYHPGDLILSHAPPYGTKADRIHSGIHVGSRALRKFIEEKQPPLVLTGHIHEARSVDTIGETLVVNPGPLFRGYYAIIEVENGRVRAKLEKL